MLDVDARIDKCGGQVLGEVLQVVGQLLTRDGGEVHQVDLIDQDEIGAGLREYLADGAGDVGGVVPGGNGRELNLDRS
ncbi:hypothetical protein [Streptomyces sp. A30]|uniref:hypothetical protein n=1 Tax=Streptomyces sp. A30 TaxID=2789273 RepID=UPI003980AC59